jgi:hypothetical protein
VTTFQEKQNMNHRNQWVYAGLATLLLASCGSDSGGAEYPVSEVHACEIVPGTEISQIAGVAVTESSVDVERSAGGDAFSLCTHTLEGSRKWVAVQIRTSGAPMSMSRQSDADVVRSADDSTGYSKKFAEAIDAGTEISGLGDVAYAFEISETLVLVAYQGRHVEVRVSMPTRSDDKERLLKIEREIAEKALEQF